MANILYSLYRTAQEKRKTNLSIALYCDFKICDFILNLLFEIIKSVTVLEFVSEKMWMLLVQTAHRIDFGIVHKSAYISLPTRFTRLIRFTYLLVFARFLSSISLEFLLEKISSISMPKYRWWKEISGVSLLCVNNYLV